MTCEEANQAQIVEWMKTATREELCDVIIDLSKRLAGAEFAAELNAGTVKAMRQELRDAERESFDIAAEQRWKDIQGGEYGSY